MRHISPTIGLSLTALVFAGCGMSKAPDATVRDLIKDVTQGKASAIWHALPESYQGDINQACRMLADKLDPEVYDEGFAIAREFIEIVRSKPGQMSDVVPSHMARIDLDQHADAIFDLFEKLTSGQVTTVEGIRKLDVARFLDRTGGALFDAISGMAEEKGQNLDDLLSQVKIDVQNHDGDNCVLSINGPNMPMAFPVPFQRVGGKWIPTALVAAWPSAMTNLRNGIREMPSMSDPETKKRMLADIARAKQQLAAARKAESKEELREMMQQMARPPK